MEYVDYIREAFNRANELKSKQTKYEKAFFYNLSSKGILLISQKIVFMSDLVSNENVRPYYYIVDFYIPSANLIIEIDGAYHRETRQVVRDMYREKALLLAGYNVLRFNNEDVSRIKYKDLKDFIVEKSMDQFNNPIKGVKYVWKS